MCTSVQCVEKSSPTSGAELLSGSHQVKISSPGESSSETSFARQESAMDKS